MSHHPSLCINRRGSTDLEEIKKKLQPVMFLSGFFSIIIEGRIYLV